MTSDFSKFITRLQGFISQNGGRSLVSAPASHVAGDQDHGDDEASPSNDTFNELALELFALQFARNAPYRKFCDAREASPRTVRHWTEAPAIPTSAFKERELSCLPIEGRTTVFHSSGTTGKTPGRHFHNATSLAIYEASLLPWFHEHVLPETLHPGIRPAGAPGGVAASNRFRDRDDIEFVVLTPPPAQARNSSLVYMFDTVRRKLGPSESVFVGEIRDDGAWNLNFESATAALRRTRSRNQTVILLGTAFSFVHLLDFLAGENLRFQLPPGSRAMETGGYKGRSRSLSKAELHALVSDRLGVPQTHIVCEYGMSELSSQAYDVKVPSIGCRASSDVNGVRPSPLAPRPFHFPPWVRAQMVSPETGRKIADGETGLIRVFDLANVFSVMAIQTEDLGIRRGDRFELIGRAAFASPRGCSLLTA